MVVYNQTFFDLNNKRGWCVDGASGFPPDTVSDLKLAIPDTDDYLVLGSLYIQDETVRLTVLAVKDLKSRLVATFATDAKSTIRIGVSYPLKSVAPGYGGVIVFGPGIDADFTGREQFRISEECYTRYEPSCISCVKKPCDTTKLTGQVRISGGDETKVTTNGVDVPEELFFGFRALRITLKDNGASDMSNPIIALSNGIHSYFDTDNQVGPIYKIFGAVPDETGNITLAFDEHFHFAPVGTDPETAPSTLALGTDMTVEDICRESRDLSEKEPDKSGEEPCNPSQIQFVRIHE